MNAFKKVELCAILVRQSDALVTRIVRKFVISRHYSFDLTQIQMRYVLNAKNTNEKMRLMYFLKNCNRTQMIVEM